MANEKNSKIETAEIIAKAYKDYEALIKINEKLDMTLIDEVMDIHFEKASEYFDIRVPASVRKVIAEELKKLFADAAIHLKKAIEDCLS